MKRGKEEEMMMRPLFPRLHVNDADKGGGPRAPPRNKMALYEQLSVPLLKLNSAAAGPSHPHRSLPSYVSGNLVASASTSQGGGQESSTFSPFYMHQPPSQSAEMVQSRPSIANDLNSAGMQLMRRSVRHVNPLSSSALGSATESNTFRPHGFSNVKSSYEKNLDNEDDLMVSTFVRSDTAHSSKDRFMMETKRSTPLNVNSPHKSHSATPNTSIRFQSSHDKPLEQKSSDRRSRIYERNPPECKSKEVIIKEQKEKDVNNLGPSAFQGHSSQREIIEKSHKKNTRVGLVSNDFVSEPECLNANAENEDALQARNQACKKASLSLNITDDYNRGSDSKVGWSLELNDGDKNEVSESSMLDSVSDLGISPDDVVELIGQKQFLKIRRAIVNQQRVFATQVFELHRLIKVQKLLAASPYLLLEENLYASGSPQKVPSENAHTESIGKIIKLNDDSQKPNQKTESRSEESRSEETTPVPPLHSHGDGLNKGPHLLPMYSPYTGNPASSTLDPAAPGNNPTPWCYPPANHWLVPVMSPSEGLIYKPYAGPCPPPSSFMAPVYGNCGPLPAVDGDFMITPHQQNMPLLSGAPIPPTYFPPSGLLVMNTNISALAAEQVSPFTGPIPRPQIEQQSTSSCNMGIHEARPKVPTSKDNELQGSTASSPFEKAQTLPLFPTAPAVEGSGRASVSRVIKVVPHNPRSATESVARIIQSIQKERQQYESQ